jgi:hypothetical protein
MRKVQFTALFWTMLLAIPLTVLALSVAAYLTENLGNFATAANTFGQATTIGARGWLVELSERWPEVAGMIVGQLVIMIILILARRNGLAEETRLPQT